MTLDYKDMSLVQRLDRVRIMAHLTFMNYATIQQQAMDAPEWGWTMVARANAAAKSGPSGGLLGIQKSGAVGKMANSALRTVNTFHDPFGDHLLLYQHQKSLECAIVFEGSSRSDLKDWLSNLNF